MYHFIGIKGSGMASLACIMADKGEKVKGSDIEKYIFTQQPLEERNIEITSFDASNINPDDIVIVGLAFDETNAEVKQAKALNCKMYYYNEFLGELMKEYISISVAGTHGKTSTTGMLSHVMNENVPTGYLIGDGTGEMMKDAKFFVLESCEYQRHFLAYYPDYAIITNIELDHVDYYKDMSDYKNAFETFANQVKKCVVLFGDDENIRDLNVKSEHIYYGVNDGNDVQARNIVQSKDGMTFDVYYKGTHFGCFKLPFVGNHVLWNTLSVISIGILEGFTFEQLQHALETFDGVKRRFNIETKGENVYIDDYAHHPTAVKVTIEAARIKYPDKKVIAIFKPDRYSRVNYFLDDFATSLKTADEVFLCHFPENAKKEPGIDIDIFDLAKRIENSTVISEDEAGAEQLAAHGPAVFLFMSSKDIYKLKNIVKSFH